jgi:hypothetical protein
MLAVYICEEALWVFTVQLHLSHAALVFLGGVRIFDKILLKLIAVISHDNYYSQFYRPSCDLHNNRILPLIRQLPYSK